MESNIFQSFIDHPLSYIAWLVILAGVIVIFKDPPKAR